MADAASAVLRYNLGLKAEITTVSGVSPHTRMHRVEWKKIMAGEPVEINPSVGTGFRVMTVEEWSSRWKRNEDFPECLVCQSTNTKEHYFTQSWCRGRKRWESETLCLNCHSFSFRSYSDPDFKTPEEWEKQTWTEMTREQMKALSLKHAAKTSSIAAS